ncbi:hypothetical protein BJ912DRAFT_1151231 [Pholiota molesta]|nr:hypothetical protein BJ912DRAFT_1151231 [Pholiota molesta]
MRRRAVPSPVGPYCPVDLEESDGCGLSLWETPTDEREKEHRGDPRAGDPAGAPVAPPTLPTHSHTSTSPQYPLAATRDAATAPVLPSPCHRVATATAPHARLAAARLVRARCQVVATRRHARTQRPQCRSPPTRDLLPTLPFPEPTGRPSVPMPMPLRLVHPATAYVQRAQSAG